jgi:hypothetical protein
VVKLLYEKILPHVNECTFAAGFEHGKGAFVGAVFMLVI